MNPPGGFVQIIVHISHIADTANAYHERGFGLNAILPLPDPMQKVLLFKENYRRPNFTPNKIEIKDKKKKNDRTNLGRTK
jgi:hypothetical protein